MNTRTYLASILVIVLFMGTASGALASEDDELCPPLDLPTGETITVSTESELQDAVSSAASGTIVLVSPGVYNLEGIVHVANDDVTIRGATGNRDDVILDGGGMLATGRYHVILINADDVTIADLTIRNGDEHGISVQGNDRPTLYNLHIIDTGYQLVKVNPVGDGSEDGLLACSRLEYTDTSPENYTNGISAHDAHGWTVRDNRWERIRTPGNTPAPTILFWSGSSDTVVERNLLVDCYQGIAFGNSSDDDRPSHSGGIVRNNVIYASQPHDSVIEMVHATDWLVAHNTALLLNSTGVTWSMEARFGGTTGTFAYNLTNMPIINRNGSGAGMTGNVTDAQPSWFVDAANADLHLLPSATQAIDQASSLAQVTVDIDGDPRPIGSAPDVGADEYGTIASLALIAPTGETSWPVSSTRQIRWTTTGSVPEVRLLYANDGFTTTHVISSPVINTGVYTWTTPPTPTRSARVRVASVVSPAVISDTSAAFTLYDPSTFTNTVHLPLMLRAYSPSAMTDGDLIQPSDLVYRGAFRLPDSPGTPEDVGWAWSNWASAATYYPDGDPSGDADGYPGSIFGVGHDHTQYVSEVSIPPPVDSPGKGLVSLNTATTLQPFADIRDGMFGYIEMPRVGLAYLPAQGAQTTGKLYFAWASHLDEGATDPSHGWSELDLANPQSAGPWRIDNYWNYVTGDYLFDIPQNWADSYVSGQYLATGRFRDGGQGAQGPALFAVAPWERGNPPAADSTLAATPLLLYSAVTDAEQYTVSDYHHSDEWTGAAWLTAGERAAVVFVGTKGTGDCWYGCADGTDAPPWPNDCDRGWWSSSFVARFLFYDPADLAAVAQGTIDPHAPQPYAMLDVDDALYHVTSDQQKYHVGALAFDRARGLLYLFEPFGDGDKPLVHVWGVE